MPKTTFNVTLENVELSNAQISKMEKEINAVVAKYLVKGVSEESPLGLRLKPKPEWLGIYLKKFKSVADLKANVDFKKFKNNTPVGQ